MSKFRIFILSGLVLASVAVYQGCNSRSRPRGNQTGGAAGQTPPTSNPTPAPTVTIDLIPSGKVTLVFGATLNFDVEVREGTMLVDDPEGKGRIKYELLNGNIGSINANTGAFTASQTTTGVSTLRVTYTQGNVSTSKDFTDFIEVVNTPPTPSPPKTIRLDPFPKQVVQGENFTFRLFVDREDGTTVEPMATEFSATLSNVGIGNLSVLTFTAFTNATGKSDIVVDVTMAGVTLNQTFAGAVEVITAAGGGGSTGNFHGNNLGDVAIVTTDTTTNGHGLVAYGTVSATSGNNATVQIRLFLGPFAGEDNTPAAGKIVYLHPDYKDGAEANRPAADYVPLAMTPVAGTNNLVWELTFAKFPTTGTLSFTVTTDGDGNGPGTTFMRGFPFDKSFNPARNNLEASLVNGQVSPRVNP